MPRQRAILSWLVVGLLTAGGFVTTPSSAKAQDLTKQVASLKLVPANAGSYRVMLRNREQLDIILKSNAVAKLMKLPFAKKAKDDFDREWTNPGGPFAPVKEWYTQKANAQIVEIVKDLVSDEVFVYADRNAAEFLAFFSETYSAGSMAPFNRLLKDGPLALAGGADQTMQFRAMARYLAQNPEKLKFPDVVMGFKLSKTKPAVVAKLIDGAIDAVVNQAPAPVRQILVDRLKKSKIHGATVHSLVLDGSLVPWDMIPFNQIEEKEGEFDKLKKRLKEMKLTFAVSVRENFLLLSVGEGTAGLKNLGGAAKRLIDREELAPVIKFAGRRLTSINYISKESRSIGDKFDVEGSAKWVEDVLKDTNLKPAQKAKIDKDIKSVLTDLKRSLPEIGAYVDFTFLSKRGYEGYEYDWTKNQNLDSTKPLTILEHVGGNPIGFFLARSTTEMDGYEEIVKMIKMAYQYVEELAVPEMPEEVKEPYKKFMKQAMPYFVRLHKATGKMFLPSLDGQGGWILDAKLKLKFSETPIPNAMPVPEVAVIVGLRDAKLFREAMAEYRTIFNGLAEIAVKMAPPGVNVPEIAIPEPKTKKTKNGTLYYWPLPEVPGLDPKLMPTGGISSKVAAFGASQQHITRLLTKTPFKLNGGPLGNAKKPLAMAAYFHWAGLVDAAMPWVEFGLTESRAPNEVIDQVMTVVDVLKCFRSYASATYVEGSATVTHAEAVFRDLEK